jgi:flagellar basal body-associated protein FliL
MAEKPQDKAAAKDAASKEADAPAKKKFPLKSLVILLAVLLVEGIAISAAFLLSGGPQKLEASSEAEDKAALAEKPVEALVIADKFQNTRTGRTYLYDTEIYVLIKTKHEERVKKMLESMKAQIATDIATIFRRAEPGHLLEPSLATLQRQIKASLDDMLGKDEQGNSIVDKVLITKCTQIRLDS